MTDEKFSMVKNLACAVFNQDWGCYYKNWRACFYGEVLKDANLWCLESMCEDIESLLSEVSLEKIVELFSKWRSDIDPRDAAQMDHRQWLQEVRELCLGRDDPYLYCRAAAHSVWWYIAFRRFRGPAGIAETQAYAEDDGEYWSRVLATEVVTKIKPTSLNRLHSELTQLLPAIADSAVQSSFVVGCPEMFSRAILSKRSLSDWLLKLQALVRVRLETLRNTPNTPPV